jgi:hypothetical protein
MQTEISFTSPTTNADGTPITQALSFTALIDTVNPPVKSYTVPASATVAAGVVTVTFAQLGFTPANGSTYYVDVTATDASGTSVPSGEVTFVYAVPPSPPTGLKVS